MRCMSILIALLLTLMLSCRESPAAVGDVRRGEELFREHGCASCHGREGLGDGPAARGTAMRPRNFADRTAYRNGSTPDAIARTIRDGIRGAGGGMPAFAHIPSTERAALASFIVSRQQRQKAADVVTITGARIAPPIGNRTITAGFLTLHNRGADTALVAANCGDVKQLELHQMESSGGMMRMKMVERIPLPAGQEVRLHSGGLHLMLIGLKRRIAEGDVLVVRLRFADGSTSDVRMPVRKGEEE